MVMNKKAALGRGLDALLGDYEVPQAEAASAQELPIELLMPNPAQPRKAFDEERLNELAGSLKRHGMVQPIVVRREGEQYMIVTGERRYRAALRAGLTMVPVVERDYEDSEIHEIALIENIQRENLNPIEEAAAIAFLMHQHDLTQEEVSERLSKSRPAVANTLRLLTLTDPVKEMLRAGKLSAGHGRALSALEDTSLQEKLAAQAAESGCSVRALEQIVKAAGIEEETVRKTPHKRKERPLDADLYEVEERLRERLGTKVKIQGGKKRGKITIEYYSMDALQEIYELIVAKD